MRSCSERAAGAATHLQESDAADGVEGEARVGALLEGRRHQHRSEQRAHSERRVEQRDRSALLAVRVVVAPEREENDPRVRDAIADAGKRKGEAHGVDIVREPADHRVADGGREECEAEQRVGLEPG